MKTNVGIKPPKWYWVVSVVALIWNGFGVLAYLMEAYKTDADKAALPEAERMLYEAQPAWVTGAFAVAVWAGLAGCIALLLRKKWARPVFLISLLGVLVQQYYLFVMSDTFAVYGNAAMIMPIAIIVISIALLWFSNKGIGNNWIS